MVRWRWRKSKRRIDPVATGNGIGLIAEVSAVMTDWPEIIGMGMAGPIFFLVGPIPWVCVVSFVVHDHAVLA